MMLRGDGGAGYIRVDWFTPDGLATWGDGRLTILGHRRASSRSARTSTSAARPGGSHLFLVDQKETRYIDCRTCRCRTARSWSPTSSIAPRPRCRRRTVSSPPSWC